MPEVRPRILPPISTARPGRSELHPTRAPANASNQGRTTTNERGRDGPRPLSLLQLDPQAAADLQRLAGAVDFSRPRDGGAGVPDAFHYHIVAEHGSERHELTVGESQLDPPLKELVDWLMQRARNPRQ